MPVIGVLAEAQVGHHHQIRQGVLEGPDGPGGDARGVAVLAPAGILAVRDAEQDHRRDAEGGEPPGLGHQPIDRPLGLPRQRADWPPDVPARADEERGDQVPAVGVIVA